MHQKVFGKEGDFITSPEISQAFGEVCRPYAHILLLI
jgi:SAM-dependent MidA family methyltransferase